MAFLSCYTCSTFGALTTILRTQPLLATLTTTVQAIASSDPCLLHFLSCVCGATRGLSLVKHSSPRGTLLLGAPHLTQGGASASLTSQGLPCLPVNSSCPHCYHKDWRRRHGKSGQCSPRPSPLVDTGRPHSPASLEFDEVSGKWHTAPAVQTHPC